MSLDNLSGTTLGQYRLIELLGQGGMSAVYRAYQSALSREVAVKVLPPVLAQHPDYLERFNREAQTAASLQHPHILHVYDYGTEKGISYVVMQLLTGGTLRQKLIERARGGQQFTTLDEMAALLKELASAIDYAHSRGVVHRDIKPGNIMFDEHGNAYLVDFGIARLLGAASSLTGTGAQIGTPAYMSPEQWRGRDVGPATDQYALGIVAYALVAGRLPFVADESHVLMYKHMDELPPPVQTFQPSVPGPVNEVLQRALAKNPYDRYLTVTAFVGAFEAAVAGFGAESTYIERTPEGLQITPPSPRPGTPTPGMTAPSTPLARNPLFWGLGVILVIVAAIIVAMLASGGGGELDELAVEQTHIALALTRDALTARVQELAVITPTSTRRPTNTPTATRTPSPTDDLPATAQAQATQAAADAAAATAEQETQIAQLTANAPTNTPRPTITPSPTATPTATSTLSPTVDTQATIDAQMATQAKATLDIEATAAAQATQTRQTALAVQATLTTDLPTPVPPTATPEPLADLHVLSVSGPAEVVIPAGAESVTETYTISIRNQGAAQSGPFASLVLIHPDGTLVDLGVVSDLGAGQTVNLAVDISFETAGAFSLQLFTDSSDDVEESNEANNFAWVEVTVTAPAATPTLPAAIPSSPTPAPTQPSPPGFTPITAGNIDQLESGYVLPGQCGAFSADSMLLATYIGVYDLATGQRLLPISGYGYFSPDNSLVAVRDDGVYDVATGVRRFAVASGYAYFNPDSTLVVLPADGVYEVATGERRFAISNSGHFSPDGALLVVNGDGVYDVGTGERLFEISGSGLFSPDSALLAVSGDGVYNIATGQRLFPISNSGYFSPDSTLVVVREDGVYEVATGQRRFAVSDYGRFNPAGTLLAVYGDGVYDVATGERRFEISGYGYFNSDGTLLVAADVVYDGATGERRFVLPGYGYFSPDSALLRISTEGTCRLYGMPDNPWPYRSGLVAPMDFINVRRAPDGDVVGVTGETLVVLARNSDGSWLQVAGVDPEGEAISGWVAASVVSVIDMPDGVSVVDPFVPPTATPTPPPTATPVPTNTPDPNAMGVAGFAPITTDNAHQITLAYGLPGQCVTFSPDGRLLVTTGGLYDLALGVLRLDISGSNATFSPDGSLVATSWGVYDVRTGAVRVSGSYPIFSPDGSLVATRWGGGVYEAGTGQKLFDVYGNEVVFSPDGTLLAATEDAVYDVATGERLYLIWGHDYSPMVFSPDSALLAVSVDGVYDLSTGQRRFTIAGGRDSELVFSPDSTRLAVARDGVYDTVTGEQRFGIWGRGVPAFSPDSRLLITDNGTFDAVTGIRLYDIASYDPVFSPDGTLLATSGVLYDLATGERRSSYWGSDPFFSADGTLLVTTSGVFEVATGDRRGEIEGDEPFFSPDAVFVAAQVRNGCLVYGLADNRWPYRLGRVTTGDEYVNMRSAPNGEIIRGESGEFAVFARTGDGSWYMILGTNIYGARLFGWISSSAVEVIESPDGVPVEGVSVSAPAPTSTTVPEETGLVACQLVDVDGSGAVDILDFRLVSRSYGSAAGDENYNAAYDFDGNGIIDVLDLRQVSSQYGQTCSPGA